MKIIRFLVDNWWLLFFVYGIWRAVTKKSPSPQALAEKRIRDQAVQDMLAQRQAARQNRLEETQEENVEDTRIYKFDNPVEQEEEQDDQARIAAFKFVPAENLPTPVEADEVVASAKRILRENLEQVYGVQPAKAPGLDTAMGISMTPDALRRAIILSEIILPPKSRRLHR